MAKKELIIHSDMKLEHKVMGLLQCIAQEQNVRVDRCLRPMNLSYTQLNILHILSQVPTGQLTVNQIKQFMIDESPNVSRSLNKLMENGHIIKERSKEDQRVVYITITDSGRELHKTADQEILKLSLNLSEEDLQTVYEILVKIE
ncbi:MarR family winged helix-turn-helix transcriptional regulator [Vallitalea okinawensis]|uniref:MarR family winged helix-turn-helix transcriptional regulator n=1 Tax=Vallitalea okinawensis TaxID=2078660 RepID=UPI001A9A5CD4|nr:MarR family transcriptional regulator [Vallitalea okinawensis]